ncbi:hypothetical protein CPC08DRAFT_770439 [Agrocybe pediades]|nr:hypothetical protein CPC08DRAFT_770439 [Agrocybe pediades]
MNTMLSSSSNNHNAMGDPTSPDETLMDGMRPSDVLTCIFGSTIAPSELEDALAVNGYDFERAMGWLVDSRAGAAPGGVTSMINAQQGQQGPRRSCGGYSRKRWHAECHDGWTWWDGTGWCETAGTAAAAGA